jgi:cyclic beta-1,2-glucan synthetase
VASTGWPDALHGLSPAQQRLLAGEPGPLLWPIRSEIFGPQRFAQHGRSLGLTHEARRAGWGRAGFFPRLLDNIRMLREAYQVLLAQTSGGDDVSPASLWLLDNFHLIDAQLLTIHEGLPRSYFRALPVLQDEPLAGLPRVYGVAWAFVAHTDSAFDEDLLEPYLCAYQESRELRLAEIWALPTTLRVVLVENLRRLAERLATFKAARALANRCCDSIERGRTPDLPATLARVAQRGAGHVFLAQLGQRLQDRASGASQRVPADVRDWLQGVLPNLAALQAQQTAEQTADNLSVGNAVGSLRAIGEADWPCIVARVSPLTRLMLTSPLFAAEQHATQDDTLHGIERLAVRRRCAEMPVAKALLALMDAHRDQGNGNGNTDPGAVAGHWLAGAGQGELDRALTALGIPARWRWPGRRAWQPLVLPLYLGTLAAGTVAVVEGLLRLGPGGGGLKAAVSHAVGNTMSGALNGGLTAWPALLLLAWPASEAVVALLHRLIGESTRPQRLPRLALAEGIPPEHRAIVVIPAMLSDGAAIEALVHRLELHYLANPEPQAQFALLSDWADADAADAGRDEALLAHAVRLVEALNARHAAAEPRFLLLHRRRSYSSSERRWIGWERKRGKLEQLVAALAEPLALPLPGAAPALRDVAARPGAGTRDAAVATGTASAAFIDLGLLSLPAAGTRYIVTLDSDTQLPPGRLRELVGVAAHPANRPRLSPDRRRVVAGYGILQPHLATPLPQRSEDTWFHRMFAGQSGIDPYSAASAEVYQDLFGEGSFTGKGLLDVQALHAVLSGSLPEGQVLSHDLLEGALVRCAAVTDVTLIEDAPFHAEVAASRVHRWTRGDWQLLPILLHSLVRPSRYPLGAVNRWKIADNLRRSLVAPVSLALVVLALAGGGPLTATGGDAGPLALTGGGLLTPTGAAATSHALATPALLPTLALVLAAFVAGPLLGALAGLVPGRAAVARLHFYRAAGLDLLRALAGGLWHLAMLLQHALLAVDAIVRALWRVLVSQRRLLQWTTAANAVTAASGSLSAALRRQWSVPLVALLLGAALWAAGTPHPVWSAALCLLWGAAPLWSWAVSRTGSTSQRRGCTPADAAYLLGIARATWRYFERCVTADDHHLPPDNLQTLPHDMLARRTSPTNIGLYLLSACCARQFGWITPHELVQRLTDTLGTLDRLQRHRGHFLNWYDTATCAALPPLYVSTVDSGNLSGHLLAVAQACRALAEVDAAPSAAVPADGPALRALARRFEALAWAPDFTFLYHPRRHLLHIGYRLAEQQLDASFYDLLASESRLTSLLAIAKGDVPVRHWAALGRPFFAVHADAALRSWSGSMFEYLMPTLVLAQPHGSLLQEACHAAVTAQRAFGAAHGVPWGISESAYAGSDHTLAYQYAPQGVPRLALRRTPADELVIAPYATGLALLVDPQRATRNFEALQALGARGVLGFIEAMDYTPSRQVGSPGGALTGALTGGQTGGAVGSLSGSADASAAGNPVGGGVGGPVGSAPGSPACTPVYTFMAHHQGMTLVALANVLLDGAPQRWGLADAHIEAVASLLHERAPREVSRLLMPPPALATPSQRQTAATLQRNVRPGEHAIEPTHLLSNGRYSVALRANGAGRSRCGAADVTRSRDDALRDAHGSFLWLRRMAGSARSSADTAPVSLTQHPAPDPAADYHAVFHADRVCLNAEWPDLQARITVWVSPEDDVEFRRVELINLGERTLDLELISTFEPTLADARADEAHPAFGNLFVSAHGQAAQQALWFERRPRLATEAGLHAVHFLAESGPALRGLRCQVDRQRWLGRNRPAWAPLATLDAWPDAADDAPAVLDTGLDPLCALGARVVIAPGALTRLTFATAASADREVLAAVVDKYHQPSHIERAALMSVTLAGIRLRALRIGPDTFTTVQSLTTALLQTLSRPDIAPPPARDGSPFAPRAAPPMPAAPVPRLIDRRLLWRFGISGDRPVLLVSAAALPGLGLLRALSQAMSLWAWGGVACDLVVVNAEPASYEMPLQRELAAWRDRHDADAAARGGPASTGWHLLRADDLSADELATLQGLARLRLLADGRSLAHHLNEWAGLHELALRARQEVSRTVPVEAATQGAAAEVTSGHFAAPATERTGEFVFDVGSARRPTRPWINVLANPGFGTQVSEAGGGTTWAVNSRLNQLTPWSNDPVADPPSEWLLLQDLRSRALWSVAPSAHAAPGVAYHVRHGQGYSVVEHGHEDLAVRVTWCVDPVTAVKQVQLHVVNHGPRTRRLRWIGVCEWLLGAQRSDRASVHTAVHRQPVGASNLLALLATQQECSAGFGGGTAFLAMTMAVGRRGDAAGEGAAWARGRDADAQAAADSAGDWTCDRREFFDASGRPVVPDHFSGQQGHAADPCAALSLRLDLAPGASAERCLLLGWAASPAQARRLAAEAAAVPPEQRLRAAQGGWDTLLGTTEVTTPDPLFDALVNRWLLYQAVSCRLWGKAAFYQAGGATGFRDQLQDTLALTWAAPDLLRAQLLRCAGHQFVEGDVLHWWHETAASSPDVAADHPPGGLAAPTGAGVRTHFSDDLLWLPYALSHYLRRTGDASVLDVRVPFVEGPPIPDGAEDLYATPTTSTQDATVYEHAARTLDYSLHGGTGTGVGVHGLPLMGSGDWNDGMNRVGHGGRGESVWLAWFLCRVVADFAPLARERGEAARAQRWDDAAQGWRRALDGPAWDGDWYVRAFFDDGQPLGSHHNTEARIDLIAQAWSVLSGAAPPVRQAQALAAAQGWLVDQAAGLIRLLDPPLAQAQPSAGYIQAYPPGVRENGGQYTHAGVWALMAQAAHAKTQADPGPGLDVAWQYFKHLSPAHRAADPVQAAAYGVEPYVVAGDVYSAPPWVGRGGWSWYTGAAAWLHRAAIESVIGLEMDARTLRFAPGLPSHWPRAELTLRRDGRRLHFLLLRCRAGAGAAATLAWGAGHAVRELLPGQRLDWQALAADADAFFLVPLGESAAVAPAEPALNAA